MKLSPKRKEALYKAIHDPIMRERLEVIAKSNNKIYVPLAVDEILFKLESRIWKQILAVLNVEE